VVPVTDAEFAVSTVVVVVASCVLPVAVKLPVAERLVKVEVPEPVVTTGPLNVVVPDTVRLPVVVVPTTLRFPPAMVSPAIVAVMAVRAVIEVVASVADVVAVRDPKVPVPAVIELRVRL